METTGFRIMIGYLGLGLGREKWSEYTECLTFCFLKHRIYYGTEHLGQGQGLCSRPCGSILVAIAS